jgi:hypothetical protein
MTVADLEGMRGMGEPSGILLEPWFIEGVLLQVQPRQGLPFAQRDQRMHDRKITA